MKQTDLFDIYREECKTADFAELPADFDDKFLQLLDEIDKSAVADADRLIYNLKRIRKDIFVKRVKKISAISQIMALSNTHSCVTKNLRPDELLLLSEQITLLRRFYMGDKEHEQLKNSKTIEKESTTPLPILQKTQDIPLQ